MATPLKASKVTFRANRRGKIHAFDRLESTSTCGWVLLKETASATAGDFARLPCPPCRRNLLGDKSNSCAHCGLSHLSLSSFCYRQRVDFIRKRDGDRCLLCLELIDFSRGASRWTRPSVDHVLERRNGGCTHPRNLRLVHVFCNSVREHYADPRHHPGYRRCVRPQLRTLNFKGDSAADGAPCTPRRLGQTSLPGNRHG
jgi:hypothetical protein